MLSEVHSGEGDVIHKVISVCSDEKINIFCTEVRSTTDNTL
jgi:hypothetical protein